MSYETTHWTCGEMSPFDKFVDDQVYAALRDYAEDVMVFAEEELDKYCVYLADGRAGDRPIFKIFSLRDTLMEPHTATHADGALHPETCAENIKLAKYLKDIAAALELVVETAGKVNHLHEWK